MRDKDNKRLEDDLLVLVLDNYSLRLYHEASHYTDKHRPPNSDVDTPGKSYTWYASKLQIGSKTLLRITKQACSKQLLEEKEVKRFRSQDMRYELTPMGARIAARLKSERTGDLPECPEDQLIKVRVQVDLPLIQEEPILVFNKENCLTSLAAVTLLREKFDNKEYIITRSDTTIVTVKREENGQKILVKGIEIGSPLYERIKRMVRITLCDKDLQFAFVPHKPLPRTYLSTTKNLKTIRAKRMLQQWNCFKKAPFS